MMRNKNTASPNNHQNIVFPDEFEARMKDMLGEDYEAFVASYGRERRSGLRVNVLRSGWESFEESGMFGREPIPWAPHGFYCDPALRPGKSPLHEAGVYYLQEPSAMAVAALSGVKPGMRVLDLCAAPGGKSTHLASMMKGEGILLSNEIHPARAKILSQNIERMGIINAIVTNETPGRLAERFPVYFDVVVTDAPCSGEGMFRKEEEAIPNWSLENVRVCAERQRGILDCAAQMTAPGGTLVYSTCTFAPEENEQNAALFLMRHPEFELADLPAELGEEYMRACGLAPGMPRYADIPEIPDETREKVSGCIRLWPHKLEGEGHFLAVFKKAGTPFERRVSAGVLVRDKEALRLWDQFCGETLTQRGAAWLRDHSGRQADAGLVLFGKELYRVPHSVDLRGLKVLRAGLHLGTVKKNRFEPSHALAHALAPQDVQCCAQAASFHEPDACLIQAEGKDASDTAAACAYLRGESLQMTDEIRVKDLSGKGGWCLVTVCGFAAGWGKLTGNQIKNHYPKGLRRPY